MPQEIPVCARLKKAPVALFALLSDRQGNGAVGMSLLDLRNDLAYKIIRKMRILPSLQHESPEIQRIAAVRTVEDLLFREAVSLNLPVIPAEAAVQAVVFADIRELDEPAQVNVLSVYSVGLPAGFIFQKTPLLFIQAAAHPDQLVKIVIRQRTVPGKGKNQFFSVCHEFSFFIFHRAILLILIVRYARKVELPFDRLLRNSVRIGIV